MIRIKPGVRWEGLRPEAVLGIVLADQVYAGQGVREMWVTSITEGRHRPDSFHYRGLAFDLRIHNVPQALRGPLVSRLREVLGDDEWDVILEPDHVHCEYDPKPASRPAPTPDPQP